MEVKHNQINPKKIKGIGLVFVRKEDPVNLFVLSITKQLYSLIGFYYTTKVSGLERVNVILSDICGIVSSKWMDPFTIDSLVYDPLVSQLSIRELLPVLDQDGKIDDKATIERNGKFKAVIAKVTSLGAENSVREWVKQLVGYETDKTKGGSTTVELVNRVMLETGNWDKIVQNGSVSMEGLIKNKVPTFIPKTSEGKNHIFTMLGSELKQVEVNNPSASNKLIQSYLTENSIFGPIKHIQLPPRNELDLNLRREQSTQQNKSFLTEAVSIFVKMLLEDRKFFDVVVDGINHNSMLGNKIDEKFKSSVFESIQSGGKVISILVSMIEKGRINYDELKNLIDCHKARTVDTLKAIDVEMNLFPNIEGCKDRIIVLGGGDRHKNKFDLTLKQIYNQMENLKKDIEKNQTACVNINTLFENVNCLIEMSGSDLNKIGKIKKGSYGGIFTTEECGKIPILFKSGKRVVVPTVGYNLKQFNCGELEELLRAMDVMSEGSEGFDNLRAEISDLYAKCEKVDCEYH